MTLTFTRRPPAGTHPPADFPGYRSTELRHPKQPLVVLMHGDREVSTKNLARQIGVKTIAPCAPAVADRHSGYQVGGTSPFGLRRPLPVYMERSIAALPRIYINGGKRGDLFGLDPADAIRVLKPTLVDAATSRT